MKKSIRSLVLVVLIFVSGLLPSCNNILTEANVNPNVVDPSVSNPNLIMPSIMAPTAMRYLDWGWQRMAGTMQHIQHDGWFGGVNQYEWNPEEWTDYFDRLRNTQFLLENGTKFHQGIAHTLRAFLFGNLTDIWGDVPYTEALKGNKGSFEPIYDSQEKVYLGIIEELKIASEIFATGDNTGYLAGYDTYYGGDTKKWQKFANSLLLRYYMRISEKLPAVAKAGIEAVYNSGVYMQENSESATINFVGSNASNSWPFLYHLDETGWSNFRRIKPAKTLMNQLLNTADPRLRVWFAPVHVQWVADPTLPYPVDEFIRKNGQLSDLRFAEDLVLKAMVDQGIKLTKRFNPKTYTGAPLDTNRFVGVPVGMIQPDVYNGNLTPGQTVQNQHVSQLSDMYRYSNKAEFLNARMMGAAEVEFILAESAFKGYATGTAKNHYENAIALSLKSWGVEGQYDTFIARPEIAFQNNLEQILTQKWIASWSGSLESWMDFKRTGLPKLVPGVASAQPVLPVRMPYGNDELALNKENSNSALKKLEKTKYAAQDNSQWAKPWVLQGTGKPWE